MDLGIMAINVMHRHIRAGPLGDFGEDDARDIIVKLAWQDQVQLSPAPFGSAL